MGIIHGHQRPLTTLRSALEGDRMHHAWIFSGPEGVGKCTVAEELARILLDPTLDGSHLGEPEPVLNTEVGILLAAGTHPDLHVIRKEDAAWSDNRQLRERKQLNIPLDLLRERMIGGRTSDGKIKEAPAYRTPSMGNGKVFIIDESELLDRTAQNVLLKTLEEPPAGTYIILVTSKPDQLLPTIRSRCQQLPFGGLGADSMADCCALNLALGETAVVSGMGSSAAGLVSEMPPVMACGSVSPKDLRFLAIFLLASVRSAASVPGRGVGIRPVLEREAARS